MGFWQRLFNIGRAKANKALDSIEEPIEQLTLKVRDLKEGYAKSVQGLAQVKALEIKYRKSANECLVKAADYLDKAKQIKARIDSGEWIEEEHKSSIILMLNKKENMENESKQKIKAAEDQLVVVTNLENKIKEMQKLITSTENQIVNLSAQAEAARVNKNVSKELSSVNVDSAKAQIAEIERRIESDNAEAAAWTDISDKLEDEEVKIEKLLNEPSPTSDNDLYSSFMKKEKKEKKDNK